MTTRPPSDPDYWYDPDDKAAETCEQRNMRMGWGCKCHGMTFCADLVCIGLEDDVPIFVRRDSEEAHIAELEGEITWWSRRLTTAYARIAELEAERDRLKADADYWMKKATRNITSAS